jgi:hypothetical protein
MEVRRPINLREYSPRWVYPGGGCVDFEIDGNAPAARDDFARRVAKDLESICDKAVNLLTSFMKDTGEFNLDYVRVFSEKTAEQGDFFLSFSFVSDCDANEYGYTYFHVHFVEHVRPSPCFWPFRFVVGFH